MNKQEFLSEFGKLLTAKQVPDVDDIIFEYTQHFDFKLADGYSEEEIAAKLGDPKTLANQFASDTVKSVNKGNKIIVATGLIFADIFAAMLFILLISWVIVMAAASIASASIGVCLISDINSFGLIPQMPYSCSVIYALSMLALAVLSACGTVYCYLYQRQLIRAYLRWHKNTMAAASGKPVYPSLAKHPQLSGAARRRMRTIALIALTVFAVCAILAYVVSSIVSGALEFWHVWDWFV